MVNEIPNFKIGASYDEVENFVNQQENLSPSVKKSIFNMIKDDREVGDGKISNKGELQMLMNLLNGTKNMPSEVQAGGGNIVQENKKTIKVSTRKPLMGLKKSEATYYKNTNEVITEYNEGSFKSSTDRYVDEDGDGNLDSREYVKHHVLYGQETYVDEDADGSFDRKIVYLEPGMIIGYDKDDNGEWRKK